MYIYIQCVYIGYKAAQVNQCIMRDMIYKYFLVQIILSVIICPGIVPQMPTVQFKNKRIYPCIQLWSALIHATGSGLLKDGSVPYAYLVDICCY